MCTDGREHIVIRDVYVEGASRSFSEDIISDDEDEIVVIDPCECRCIRQLARIKEITFNRTNALLGDGVSQVENFRIAGKAGDLQYLKRSIDYHFFGSIGAMKSGEVPPRFDDDQYRDNRRLISDRYFESALKSGAVLARTNSTVQPSSEVANEPYLLGEDESCDYQPLTSRLDDAQSHLAALYPVGDIVSEGELKVPLGSHSVSRYCNPTLWKFHNEELRQALLTIDAGRSFIIEGGTGSGKTEMIPMIVNYCLASGKRVKVMAGTDTLDVIEKRCNAFMTEEVRHKIPMGWAREEHYLIFGPKPEPEQKPRSAGIFSASGASRIENDFIRPVDDLTDVLIIDDASRLSFEISSFYSPFQLVILGDPAQICCRNSAFDVARASGFSTLHLRKNYRAINRDLLTWSNIFSYDNELEMQSRGSRRSEVRYMAVGHKRGGVSRAEVRAVVNAARRLSSQRGTLGIVAFGQKQLNAINSALHKAGIRDLAFTGLPEDVQGKQADYVLVSLNVALTPTGRLPLEIEGLEDEQCIAKMNVALSRARWKTVLFSGLLATDIDLRVATDAQTLIASVLQTFEQLPSQKTLKNNSFYFLE
ncbi:hypothetical protein ABE530_19130 [Brucella sp. TWI559]